MLPTTYPQLIELVLIAASREGRGWFSLTWFRQQICIQARIAKKRLGPRLNQVILRTLESEEELGHLSLERGTRANVISVSISAGGFDAYEHRTTPVTIKTYPSVAAKTRKDLKQENEALKSALLKMETRLARANSLIDIENNDNVDVVTGFPDAIMKRIERLVVVSKNRKHQISLMHEAEHYRYNADLLNYYFEQDMLEREERSALMQAYHEWDGGEGSVANVERTEHEV